MPEKKVYVFDTNVLLNDPKALDKFGANVLVMPMTVLEELDGHKNRKSTGFAARACARELIKIINGTQAGKNIPLRTGGTLILDHEPNDPNLKKKYASINLQKADHRILMSALRFKHNPKYPKRVTIVTNDLNLQVKAHAHSIASEEFRAANVTDDLSELYAPPKILSLSGNEASSFFSDGSTLVNHHGYNGQAVFASYEGDQEKLYPAYINGEKVYALPASISAGQKNFKPRNAEQALAQRLSLSSHVDVLVLSGMAGTGKTILSLAMALNAVAHRKGVIHIVRPTDQAGEELGFLPGGLDEKMGPYREAIENAYNIICNADQKNCPGFSTICHEQGKIRLKPINFALGVTYRGFVILDEAQNLSPGQMKLFLSRIGENTQVIINGDINQISGSSFLTKHSSGLTHLIDRMRGQKFFAHVHLVKGERSNVATAAAELL